MPTPLELRSLKQASACCGSLGFVLAISFMEAWVKFRSPILQKAIALDVGARVFRALNIVEVAFAGTLIILNLPFIPDVTLISLITMLSIQTAYLTPTLSFRGHLRLVKDIERKNLIDERMKKYYDNVRDVTLASGRKPPKWLHAVYVTIEILKIFMIPFYVW
eukprot:CAMPEP_0114491708 /NCGR_PEP_ID=MMETSP0109-20121206/3158_1 /TAXON_ID=29199 /ORGANISM="Chlorarachnion reptans, Strain CCCM449" /LENGTH=162 /DNA_ID=CAMNT_0001668487 /DNA_START=126 /DNA_END=611 /DNA_ORIENTATION=+